MIRYRQGCLLSVLPFNIILAFLANTKRQEKETKGIQIVKDNIKLSFFMPDDTIIYVENLKESTKKLLRLMSYYSKVTTYKVNMQKSTAFLYSDNDQNLKL